MSDPVPVSDPVSDPGFDAASPPPGWYPDPWQVSPARWWDGRDWTGHVPHAAPYSTVPGAWQPTSVEVSPVGVVDGEQRALTWMLRTSALQVLVVACTVPVFAHFVRSFFDELQTAVQVSPGQTAPPFPVGRFAGMQVSFLAFGALSWAYTGVRIWWTLTVCRAGRTLGYRTQFDPAIHAAGWILPVVNLWFPYIGIRDSVGSSARVRALPWWWASVLIVSMLTILVGLALSLLVSPWVGAPVAGLVQVVQLVLDRSVGQGVLRIHQADAAARV